MSRYKKYCEPCDQAVVPAKDGDCPHCGAGLTPIPRENPRERYEDDGCGEVAHPGDFLKDRLAE